MKPVIIQNLMKKMRKRINDLPMPTANEIPTRRDRSGQFILIFIILAIIALILM